MVLFVALAHVAKLEKSDKLNMRFFESVFLMEEEWGKFENYIMRSLILC